MSDIKFKIILADIFNLNKMENFTIKTILKIKQKSETKKAIININQFKTELMTRR